MNTILIEKPTPEKLKSLNIPPVPQNSGGWSVWECGPSSFDWQYSQAEVAYVYEGKVAVSTASGMVEIKKGDLVTFPRGLRCSWNVIEPIKKVYMFTS